MSSNALFGLSILMNFVALAIVTKVYLWPRLRVMPRTEALIALVIPNTFRFLGLSFLVPGVVSPSLSPAFAIPAAYGDLVAAILAGVATLALAARASWAIPMVWVFNVWGTLDLLHAIYEGQIGVGIDPGSLGAAFYIPTVVVPPLLVLHGAHFLAAAAVKAVKRRSKRPRITRRSERITTRPASGWLLDLLSARHGKYFDRQFLALQRERAEKLEPASLGHRAARRAVDQQHMARLLGLRLEPG